MLALPRALDIGPGDWSRCSLKGNAMDRTQDQSNSSLLTLEERKALLRATNDWYDRRDLRGVEFLRLLRLARDEGLLDEFLREIEDRDRQAVAVDPALLDEARL